jgi:predicted MFS family arabinose efflux permease
MIGYGAAMGLGTQATFRSVFAVGEFRAMWGAEALSQIGDQLARVALAILVYERTNSAALTGLTYALTFAPSFFGSLFLAGLADRFPRRTIMIGTDLVRAALIGLVAIPGMPLALICVLVAGVSFFQAPFKAAQLALLPDVLAGDRYVVGMAVRNITIQSAQLIGFAGGGILIKAVNPSLALGLDAATFVVSALIVGVGVRQRPAASAGDGPAGRPSFGTGLRAGAALIRRTPALRVLVLFTWLPSLLIVYEGLAAPYTAELGGGTVAVGIILAADPFGSVLGALVFGRWVPAELRPRMLGLLGIAACLPLLVCFARPGLVVSVGMFALTGAIGTALLMQATASFTRGVPDAGRGQALGLSNAGVTGVQGLSPLLAGVLADRIGAAHTVGVVGILGLAIAVPAAFAWRSAQRVV